MPRFLPSTETEPPATMSWVVRYDSCVVILGVSYNMPSCGSEHERSINCPSAVRLEPQLGLRRPTLQS